MSKTTPMRAGGSDEYRKRLRSYQTPPTVRRSPRFLPQITNNIVIVIALEATANKQPLNSTKKPSFNETHLQSPPISSAPVPMSRADQWFSTKCLREPLRSVGNLRGKPLRRSPRLSSVQCAKVEENKENASVDELNGEMDKVKERKFVEKEEDNAEKGKGQETKMEGVCEEKVGSREDDGECGGSGDWTKEQDAALQRAYMLAKPSPHFWKKVAKMVPGKSSQECFDRVNGSLDTPPQPQPRSRANRPNLSPVANFSLSGSKPFEHQIPPSKKLGSRNKNLITQKTIRHLLKKHCVNDQNHEADYFSILETSPTALSVDIPKTNSAVSPGSLSSPSFLQKCSGGRLSAHQKVLSRFKSLSQASNPSPEVLKRIKNVALHEKYIDQLHNRDARRKYIAARVGKNDGELKMVGLTAAKSALMSEAREFISHFQQMQANCQGDGDTEEDKEEEDE